jgi:hypothetical protein
MDKFWKPIEEVLDSLLEKSPSESKDWFMKEHYVSTYTQVYLCCVSPVMSSSSSNNSRPEFFHGQQLYQRLKNYLSTKFGEISNIISKSTNSLSLFEKYIDKFEAFEISYPLIDITFNYVKRHWIDIVNRFKNNEIIPIDKLIVEIWCERVVFPNLASLLEGFSVLLNESRIGQTKYDEKIIKFFSFIIQLSQSDCRMMPFSSKIVSSSTEFYSQNLIQYLENNLSNNNFTSIDESKCTIILSLWNREFGRILSFVHDEKQLSSQTEEIKQFKRILRENYLEKLLPGFEVFVSGLFSTDPTDNTIIFLKEIYQIYSSYNKLHDSLVSLFSNALKGHILMMKSRDSFVDHLLACIIWADSLIEKCFKTNADFINSRDKVLREIFNSGTVPNIATLLATCIDSVIRVSSHSQPHPQLSAMLTLFKFVGDKDSFKRTYSQFLSLRLMTWRLDQHLKDERLELEKRITFSIESSCGASYVGLLNRMISDIESEKQNFNSLPIQFEPDKYSVVFITGGSWPQAQTNWAGQNWPPSLIPFINSATTGYLSKFSGRKLDWLPDLSTVMIEMGHCLVNVSILQYIILVSIFQTGRISKNDALNLLGISFDLFHSHMLGLFSSGLLKFTSDDHLVLDESVITHFPQYLDLAFVVRGTLDPDMEKLPSMIVNETVDIEPLIQCYLVKVSKQRKELLKQDLFSAVKEAIHDKYLVTDSEIEKQIKTLIEREYMEENKSTNVIKYCP